MNVLGGVELRQRVSPRHLEAAVRSDDAGHQHQYAHFAGRGCRCTGQGYRA